MDRLRHLLLMLTALLCLGCNGDKDAEPRILTTEDLSQVRMATVISTVGEDYVLRNFPDQELQGYDDILGPIEALKTKRVDAVVTVYPNAQYALNNNPDLTLMPNALARRGLSFVVANGNTALRDSINRVILEMKADGTMDNIAARWMKPGKPLQEVPEIENVESDRVLRVGMSATYPPFAFIGANGRIIGYEAEMAQNMAKRMGMRVELSNIKFSGMISALQAGTVDVIASLQSPTDKPRHHVEFSEPYYECELVAIVRRPKKEPMNLSTRKDLKGKCLGVVTGSCDELYAEEHCGDMTLLRVNNISGVFHYDAATRLYAVEEYGQPYIDGNDNTQVAVTNLLVLQTTCNVVDDKGRITVDLSSGSGWFACGGKMAPITWQKGDANQQLRYFNEDGSPLTLGVGKSYVCIIPTNRTVTAE